MTVHPISSQPPQPPVQPQLSGGKKNDHDDDEINGVDPKKERAPPQNQAIQSSGAGGNAGSGNPNLGGNVNTSA